MLGEGLLPDTKWCGRPGPGGGGEAVRPAVPSRRGRRGLQEPRGSMCGEGQRDSLLAQAKEGPPFCPAPSSHNGHRFSGSPQSAHESQCTGSAAMQSLPVQEQPGLGRWKEGGGGAASCTPARGAVAAADAAAGLCPDLLPGPSSQLAWRRRALLLCHLPGAKAALQSPGLPQQPLSP